MRLRTLPKGAFWLARPNCRPIIRNRAGTEYRKLCEAFYAVIEAVSTELDEDRYTLNARREQIPLLPWTREFYPRGNDASLRLATAEQWKVLNNLFFQMRRALDNAYLSGLGQGKGLIVGLAKGRITIDELNAATASHPRSTED